eukprot:TRINITY_DN7471_c0_g1_i1.p1 TRINITY_DN7471_c0_g1~~TRINITY_DN7471_c0_g1_i1.p1  ORF type:complete len:412 (+),score=45.50 TRINITY_DN7471_c0_g1_i1:23-1237(+)
MKRPGYMFLDASDLDKGARERDLQLDLQHVCLQLEKRFECVFAEKHYFNYADDSLAKGAMRETLQAAGWRPHVFAYTHITREVHPGDPEPAVTFATPDEVPALPTPGNYQFVIQTGVTAALITAISLLHSLVPTDAVFVVSASDADCKPTLNLLKEMRRDVYVVHWKKPLSLSSPSLMNFLKREARRPGEGEQYLYLDEICGYNTEVSDSNLEEPLYTNGNGNRSLLSAETAAYDLQTPVVRTSAPSQPPPRPPPSAAQGGVETKKARDHVTCPVAVRPNSSQLPVGMPPPPPPPPSRTDARKVDIAPSKFMPRRICTFWLQAPENCKMGKDCTFAHGVQALHPDAVAAGCEVSRFHHLVAPTRMCFPHTQGRCSHGLSCRFAHEAWELQGYQRWSSCPSTKKG